MSKLVRTTFALLSATALVLLGSGQAWAADGDATVQQVLSGVAADLSEGTPAAALSSPPSNPVTSSTESPSTGATSSGTGTETSTATTTATTTETTPPTTTSAAPTLPTTLPTTTGDPSTTSPDDDLAAACTDLLTELASAGVPASVDCGAVLDCLEAALPDGLTLDQLGDLDDADAEAALAGIDLDALTSCIQAAVTSTQPTETTPAPSSQPVVQAGSETYYQNCDDARARGAAPVYAGQPGYRAGLDSDSDGIGCEVSEGTVRAVSAGTTARSGQLAYTGFELTPVLLTAAALVALGGGLLLGARRRS